MQRVACVSPEEAAARRLARMAYYSEAQRLALTDQQIVDRAIFIRWLEERRLGGMRPGQRVVLGPGLAG
jgi:hypothetical protein